MIRYYALDYVDEHECELVYDGQLYLTKEEAEAARRHMPHPELFDITWYLMNELREDVFGGENIIITPDLKVEIVE